LTRRNNHNTTDDVTVATATTRDRPIYRRCLLPLLRARLASPRVPPSPLKTAAAVGHGR